VRGTLSTVRAGKSELRLQLRPPELGEVRIRLTLEDNVMTARIVVSTENARGMITRQLEYLRSSLTEEGVRVDRFDVLVGEQYDREPAQHGQEAGGGVVSREGEATGHAIDETATEDIQSINRVKSENSRVHYIA
jgi:flagellar hook-length control protein FliK